MAKNGYLEKKAYREKALLDIGVDSGAQRIIDYIQCVLHDKAVMGKDVFGPKRLRKVLDAIDKRDKYYADAYTLKNEADKLQDELDAELKDIWGEEAYSFEERQPYIKQPEYRKTMKGWVD
jgi:hypothetical protein